MLWKTIKRNFSNKGLNLKDFRGLISEGTVLANTMKKYFTNITKQLNLKKPIVS